MSMQRSPVKSAKKNTDFKVRVAVRVRPYSKSCSNSDDVLKVHGSEVSMLGKQPKTFAFDRCFDQSSSQHDIYEFFGSDMVQHALEGYNACIFAYGQTGSGKSYTMLGTEEQPGLVPQICERLFNHVKEVLNNCAVTIRASFLEIYNEQVRDLLGSSPQTHQASLKVRGTGGDDCSIQGLSEYKLNSLAQVTDLLRKCAKNRSTAATKMNDTSSRSHAVISLTIKQQSVLANSANDKSTEEKISVLRLVDLAGSERAGSTGATGDRLREGSNINKSLVTLGRVISTLAQIHQSSSNQGVVVPYRESILTRLLQNSLGGNSRTAMIACVSPEAESFEQTMSSLRYADQAKRITTKARINRDTISNELHEARLAEMQKELNELRQQLSTQSSQDDSKLSKLVQFYEDEASRERVRSNLLEQQKEQAEKHSLAMADYIREISGKGISSIDTSSSLNYESLLNAEARLIQEIRSGKMLIGEQISKWKSIIV